MARPRRTSGIVALLLGAVMAVSGSAPAASDDPIPTLRLIRGANEAAVWRFPNDPAELSFGTYIAAVGGPFDLRIRRTDDGYRARQVVPAPRGLRTVRHLPAWAVRDIMQGLRGFFHITVTDAEGEVVRTKRAPLCLGGWEQARVNDRGPDVPVYPDGCWTSPLTEATVWGLDQGWAVSAPGFAHIRVPDGTYDVHIAIAARYAELFTIPEDHRSSRVRWTVITQDYPGPCEEPDYPDGEPGEPTAELEEPPCEGDEGASRMATASSNAPFEAASAPRVAATANGLPDLVSLPAHSVTAYTEEDRDVLAFGATVWNAGPGPLVVEGFRKPGTDVMTAYQYLYEKGRRVGRLDAGTLEFDARDGHDHWHFTDFARYRLLDRDRTSVVRSGKEAFCLAPTDAINLALPTANWHPGTTGLHSNCGGDESIWIREILDVGWGDTYMQYLPGQSFDISDLDNGIYYIEVMTNPDRNLRERTRDNNRALRKVRIGGEPFARTVTEL